MNSSREILDTPWHANFVIIEVIGHYHIYDMKYHYILSVFGLSDNPIKLDFSTTKTNVSNSGLLLCQQKRPDLVMRFD